jgi:hypothetical protein
MAQIYVVKFGKSYEVLIQDVFEPWAYCIKKVATLEEAILDAKSQAISCGGTGEESKKENAFVGACHGRRSAEEVMPQAWEVPGKVADHFPLQKS